MEYWLISVPNQKSSSPYDAVSDRLTKQSSLATVNKFAVPQDFKVGALDVLVSLSDELAKLDSLAESITRKISQYMADILEEQKSRLMDHLRVNDDTIDNYLLKFNWDSAKFPARQSLEQIHASLSSHINKIDDGLKSKAQAYNQVKGNLQTLERKQTGSLLTRNIGDLVKKEQFVHNSDYLRTLVVVIPKMYYNNWLAKYEKLTDYVVPRSSEMIYEDGEHGLWTVTLFRTIADDFNLKAKENRFFVREFNYNESEIQETKNEMNKLETDKKKQFQVTFRWLKVNFAESFIGLMHIKALRIFVESVLRYGLPVNFVSMTIRPNKKNIKKCRELLGQIFGFLENNAMMQFNEGDDIPGLNMLSSSEYYPYVYCKVENNYMELR